MRARRTFQALACMSLAAAATWAHDTEEAILHASDAGPGDQFGRSLDLAHHDAIGGAPKADVVGADSGAAYVFVEDAVLGWVEQQKLVPLVPVSGDEFGTATAIHGDVAAVGAPYHDANGADSGAVYVFTRTGGAWSEAQILLPPASSDGAGFGSALALSHDFLVVGSPENLNGTSGPGTVYVYAEVGGVWSLETTLTASDGAAGDLFGQSVATRHEMVVVGATGGNGVVPDTGAVYVFEANLGVWSQTAKIFAADSNASDFFGVSVGLFQDNIIAVGAPGNDLNAPNAGAAYVFKRTNGVWSKLKDHRGGSAGDLFGGSVAYSYLVLLAGSRHDDDGGEDTGSAFMYYDNAPFGTALEIWVSSMPEPGELLGAAVDVDECTMLAGAPGHGDEEGAIYLFVVADAVTTNVPGSGINPNILATNPATPPVLGEQWDIDIDATGLPEVAGTQLFGVRALLPAPVTIGIGEILIFRGSGLVFSTFQVGSGVTTHSIPIPNDPWLIGMDIHLQGVVRAVAQGFPAIALTNAETNRLGCHHD